MSFSPQPVLLDGEAHPACKAVVVVPARNEEASLPAMCDALASQLDESGKPLASNSFEIVLLLNNCTDNSALVARQWQVEHPSLRLHICERTFAQEQAHVGTARSLLMDTAWHRLTGGKRGVCGLLSTDADTRPAPDWIAQNLAALSAGADAVGGMIALHDVEYAALPDEVRAAHKRDRVYQQLVATFEDRLDPQHGDPMPRHLEHFGASLACTPEAYARAGGMLPITPLEDVAFVDALRRCGAVLRHEPRVKVSTSARLRGRVDVGLSGQLRLWSAMGSQRSKHIVASAEYLEHRFGVLHRLREFFAGHDESLCESELEAWAAPLVAGRAGASVCGQFLADIDCNALIDGSFAGAREESVDDAIAGLKLRLGEGTNHDDRVPVKQGCLQ